MILLWLHSQLSSASQWRVVHAAWSVPRGQGMFLEAWYSWAPHWYNDFLIKDWLVGWQRRFSTTLNLSQFGTPGLKSHSDPTYIHGISLLYYFKRYDKPPVGLGSVLEAIFTHSPRPLFIKNVTTNNEITAKMRTITYT